MAPSPRAEAARRARRADRGDEPWLEEAESEPTHTLVGRRALWGLVIGLAALVALVAAGLFTLTRKADGPIDIPVGDVPLVASPGPWKVPAQGPTADGVPVEGQGQILFPAGEGMEPEGAIDPSRLPEEPVPPLAGAEAPTDLLPAPADDAPAARPAPATAPAAAPAEADPAPPAGPAGTVQLGAFSSEAAARAAWKGMAARLPALAGFAPAFQPVERDGQTLWRLRATGPDAEGACSRLRLAGEECAVVR